MLSRPVEVPSDDDVRALIRACSSRAPTGVRNRALIAVMWRCGLRVGEALALEVRDVDLVAGTLRVRHGKGDKARVLGLDDTTAALVGRWVDRKPAGPLFCTLDGGRVRQDYVRHLLRRLAVRTGYEGRLHPHALRHAFTDREIREGRPMHVLRDELGHSSLSSTNRYAQAVRPAEVIESMRGSSWAL